MVQRHDLPLVGVTGTGAGTGTAAVGPGGYDMTKRAADRVSEPPVATASEHSPACPATAGEVLSEYLHAQAGDFLRSLRLHGESGADLEEAAEAARLLRRAARRISGALSVYRPITDTAWSDQLRAELAWLSGTLGLEHAYAGRLARLRDAMHRLSGTGNRRTGRRRGTRRPGNRRPPAWIRRLWGPPGPPPSRPAPRAAASRPRWTAPRAPPPAPPAPPAAASPWPPEPRTPRPAPPVAAARAPARRRRRKRPAAPPRSRAAARTSTTRSGTPTPHRRAHPGRTVRTGLAPRARARRAEVRARAAGKPRGRPGARPGPTTVRTRPVGPAGPRGPVPRARVPGRCLTAWATWRPERLALVRRVAARPGARTRPGRRRCAPNPRVRPAGRVRRTEGAMSAFGRPRVLPSGRRPGERDGRGAWNRRGPGLGAAAVRRSGVRWRTSGPGSVPGRGGRPAGIRVNVVNPDAVIAKSAIWDSPGARRARATTASTPTTVEEFYRKRTPLKRNITPEDVAEAICFFASGRTSKLTGNILNVDGGVPAAYPLRGDGTSMTPFAS